MKAAGQINNPGCVYILTNKERTTLYTGVTTELISRIDQHRSHYYTGSFSDKYKTTLLVYYRWFDTIEEAILEEKRIKGGSRKKKIDLINSINPEWKDLYADVLRSVD